MHKPAYTGDRPIVILPDQGTPFAFGDMSGFFKVDSNDTAGRFTLADMPEIPPGVLAAPLHRHRNEDEYSYVVAGRVSIMVEDEVVTATAGTWVVKPRGLWHTFWNTGETPCYVIEIVAPAGFEKYFAEVRDAGGDMERLADINARYAIDMDFESIPSLCERFGLTYPQP